MTMRAFAATILATCSILLFSAPAFAGKRVALVIGNSSYQNVARLPNPVSDSSAMLTVFRDSGFDIVELKQDLKASEMRRALRDFSDNVRDADVAIIYFAGHGIEINGTNYLIPVDAVLERDIDAFDEAIPLDRLLTVIEPARQLRLVILDACRDNPFNKTIKLTNGARSVGRGLAKVEPTSPNTLIAFAAKAGSTASDGDGKNSPFTAALVKFLPRPGLDLRKAFGFARDDVLKATNNRQEPFIYGSLGGDDVALVPVVSPGSADLGAAARRDYETALQINEPAIWDSFIRSHPSGFYTDVAMARRDKLNAEIAGAAMAEKARVALEEQKRLAAEGARLAEQKRATDQAKAAEQARLAAEKDKSVQDAKVAEAERAKAVALNGPDTGPKPAEDQMRDLGPQEPRDQSLEKVAALTERDRTNDATAKSNEPASGEVPRLLRAELVRVGCSAGVVGEDWNAAAQKSLALFNKNAGTALDVRVANLNALEVVRSKPGRICPLVCPHAYRADGESCVKIICNAGYDVGDDNTCERAARKRIVRPVQKRAPQNAPERSPEAQAASSGGSYCRFVITPTHHRSWRC
jgi:Caspase domain